MKKIFVLTLLLVNLLSYVNAKSQFEKFLPKAIYTIDMHAYCIALDSSNNMYITDRNRVIKLNRNGKIIKTWGSYGDGEGKFHSPSGIAVDSKKGFVYVVDRDNNRIQKFDLNGHFLDAWGTRGVLNGAMKSPIGVAIDSSGNVYVVDSGNNRIQKFTSNGTFIHKWGGSGDANGRFNNPQHIAIDKNNNVYVVDKGNYRVEKFSSNGTFLLKWVVSNDDMYDGPGGITVDKNLNVYVYRGGNVIQQYNSSGHLIDSFGAGGYGGPYDFSYVNGLTTDANNNLYIANGRDISKFSSKKIHITSWGSMSHGIGEFNYPWDIVATSNYIYVADTNNNRIQMFSKNGTFIKKWGSPGIKKGEFNVPASIDTDSHGNVYVVDMLNSRIQKFTSTGKFIRTWGYPGYGNENGEFYKPLGIAIDAYNNVYVADSVNNRIQKFNENGEFITSWNMTYMSAIAIDKKKNYIYVLHQLDDYTNPHVTKFDLSGKKITSWGLYGNQKYPFLKGITVDIYGNVYVSNSNSEYKIQKFSANGEFLDYWNFDSIQTNGSGVGGLTCDNLGNILLTDGAMKVYSGVSGIWKLEPNSDIDGDGVPNSKDAFPFDPKEWLDTDHDRIGNNADTDDDNDGISDVLERKYHLNPLNAADAKADYDHDGFNNAIEISVGTNIRSKASKPTWIPIIMGDIMTFMPAKP